MKNVLIQDQKLGELTLIYCADNVTTEELSNFYSKRTEGEVSDIFEEKQSNLQYYCIDGRVWIDTDEKVARMREYLKNN